MSFNQQPNNMPPSKGMPPRPLSIAGLRTFGGANDDTVMSNANDALSSRIEKLEVQFPHKQLRPHLCGPPTPSLTATSTGSFEHSTSGFDQRQCPQKSSNSPPPPPTPAASPGPLNSRPSWSVAPQPENDMFQRQMIQYFSMCSNQERMRMLSGLLGTCTSQQLSFVYQFVTPLLKKDPFTSLPDELCLRILSFVDDPKTLARAAQVSRRWRDLLGDDMTWKNLCFKHEYDRQLPTTDSPDAPEIQLAVSHNLPEYQIGRNRRLRSYKSHFKQRFLVDAAWKNGGQKSLKYITEEGGVVTSLHLTDKYIILALDNTRIHVFDTKGEQQKTLSGHLGGVWAMVPWGDMLVSGGCDRDIRVWNLATGASVHKMSGHTSTVRCLKMSDEHTAISGSRDSFLRVWNIVTGTCTKVLSGHQASVRCLEIKGDIVVSGSYDTTARVWSISEGRCLTTLQGHFSQIYAIAYDGKRVVTGSLDTNVRIWDPNTAECLAILQGHTSLVGQIQMRGDTLVTGGSDGSVRVWSLERMTPIHRLAAHDNSVTSLQFDDNRVVSGGSDGRVKIWDLKTGNLVRELISQSDAVWRVAFQSERCVALALRQNRTVMEVWSFSPPDDTISTDIMYDRPMSMPARQIADDLPARPLSAMPYNDSFAPEPIGTPSTDTQQQRHVVGDVEMEDMPQTAPAHSVTFFSED